MAPADERTTILQLSKASMQKWFDYFAQRSYERARADFRQDRQRDEERWHQLEERWRSLNGAVVRIDATLKQVLERLEQEPARGRADGQERIADELYALRQELRAQQVTHRDPFGVFATLLREVRPEAVRVGHAIWPPATIDSYLRATWRLSDPEIRRYKTVWRDAKLLAVERDNYARKFTVARGVTAYRFAVPLATYDLFRVEHPAPGEPIDT